MTLTSTVARRELSLAEFAEHFECAIRENKDLEARLKAAVAEKTVLQKTFDQLSAKFESETGRLNSEIADLQAQINSRLDSLLSMRERLIKDEYERKFQELITELKTERNKYGQMIKEMKSQLANCICRPKSNSGRRTSWV